MCVPEYSPHLEPVLSPLLLDKRVEDDTGVCVCVLSVCTRIQSPPGACVVATAARQTCRGRHRCVCVKCVYPNTVPTWSLCCRHCCSTNVSRTTQVCVCYKCVYPNTVQSPPGACVITTAARQTCGGRHSHRDRGHALSGGRD